LFSYLRTGVGRLHGAAAGTMTPVIRDGLALPVVPDSDVRAIVLYFSDIDRAGSREPNVEATVREALATSSLGSGQEYDPDETSMLPLVFRATTMLGQVLFLRVRN
jgi:hypothetical protein